MGLLIVSRGVVEVSVALNAVPSANFKLLAVLPTNEPLMFSRALEPKIMPLGLSRNMRERLG